MKKIKVGSDFSGVGAFDQALKRIGIDYETEFACDMDKFARETFVHNYGEPKYYPKNVYDRDIPSESLDIYMTSPPCQAFSLAGKRLGKDDKRGILFFNSHEFIQVNKPRFFIFENVKGLLSDDGGKTFQEWVNMLGGKSINGLPILFPYEDSVPYHLYWQVLNAKHHGVPQNRERVFLIGIRDDSDNKFQFPKEEHLIKRLKNVLESEVDEKYFLSDKMLNCLFNHKSDKFQINTPVINDKNEARTLRTEMAKMGRQDNFIKVKSATSKGFETATENDSINFSVPNSETRRGRVGKGVAQTLDTSCNQGVILGYTRDSKGKVVSRNFWENAGTIHTSSGGGGNTDQFVLQHDYKIRRLTPRECFRLMDFPDTFTWPVSDSQAYKQAGNSIVVRVLEKIIINLPL
jgi:DNA (cytosine-5)-methyltransferase 1